MITSLRTRGVIREVHVDGVHVADITRVQSRQGRATWRAVRPAGHWEAGALVGTSPDIAGLVCRLERQT